MEDIMKIILSVLVVVFFVVGGQAMAGDCDGLIGEEFGACTAYNEAMECGTDNQQASDVACENVSSNTEASECDDLTGAARGLCNAYCESANCDDPGTEASDTACDRLRSNYEKITGQSIFPCEEPVSVCPLEIVNLYQRMLDGDFEMSTQECDNGGVVWNGERTVGDNTTIQGYIAINLNIEGGWLNAYEGDIDGGTLFHIGPMNDAGIAQACFTIICGSTTN
jgi:hypothetical protein